MENPWPFTLLDHRIIAHLRKGDEIVTTAFERTYEAQFIRYAPSTIQLRISRLRNGWGFPVLGDGSWTSPYRMSDSKAAPVLRWVGNCDFGKEFKRRYHQSPWWKEVRLRRMRLDEFTCQRCDRDKKGEREYGPLEVHHHVYVPFEEEDRHLETVCDSCHTMIHSGNNQICWPQGVLPEYCERLGLNPSVPMFLLPMGANYDLISQRLRQETEAYKDIQQAIAEKEKEEKEKG